MRPVAVLLALAVLLASPLVAASEADDDGDEHDDGTDDHAGDHDDEHEADEEDSDAGTGRFLRNGTRVEGRHVAFHTEPGRIVDYSVGGQVLFTSIDFSPAGAWEEIEIEDASAEVESDEADFRAIDSAAGRFRAESDDGTVRVIPAPGVTLTTLDDETLTVGGDMRGTLHGDGVRIVDGAAEGEDLRFVLEASGVRVFEPGIESAILDGRIAAEIHVASGQAPTTQLLGGVNATAHRTDGRIVVVVQSDGPGRTVLIDLAPGSLQSLDDIDVRLDGASIGQADDLEDVLDTGDGEAEYLLLGGADGVQVLVQIPHFSIRTVELQGSVREIVDSLEMPVGVFLAAGAATVVAVALTWSLRSRMR